MLGSVVPAGGAPALLQLHLVLQLPLKEPVLLQALELQPALGFNRGRRRLAGPLVTVARLLGLQTLALAPLFQAQPVVVGPRRLRRKPRPEPNDQPQAASQTYALIHMTYPANPGARPFFAPACYLYWSPQEP